MRTEREIRRRLDIVLAAQTATLKSAGKSGMVSSVLAGVTILATAPEISTLMWVLDEEPPEPEVKL